MPLIAQWDKTESVLKDHTWYKIGVVRDGIYGLDKTALLSYGVNVEGIDPARIRLFGNVPDVLPESNSEQRFDDLTEIAIQVTGADDGSFDSDDRILFYGQGPVNLRWNSQGYYDYERNCYSDTVYYFLCTDSDQSGLRMTEHPWVAPMEGSAVISSFPYCFYHESEEMSPYASGRTWYGDMFTSQEGQKSFVFEVPDLVSTEVLHVFSRVLGRCASRFSYSLKVNDNILADHVNLEAIANLKYGTEHEVLNKMCTVNSDQVTVRYSINVSQDNPMLYVDRFYVTCWRALRFHGGELPFRLVPSQMATSIVKVQVQGTGPTTICWDVTDPLTPTIQPMTQQVGGISSFGVEGNAERRYHLFEASAIQSVASCYPIPNQNLHEMTSAEMLIITPRLFWEPSSALAEFHQEMDGIQCVLADVGEIYNEFGTGMTDPTAVRDFIRMIYLRSEGKLRYVLLMGKGTHDYRDIKGFGNNYVPTYEIADKPWHEPTSLCSDDYFALMDSTEGEHCSGLVDLGVGRFPITTPEQGNALVLKIKHYADISASHGPWKNRHLFMADNDNRTYMEYPEYLEMMLDTAWHYITTKKLYTDSYPVVSTPQGNRVPEANQALMHTLDDGVLVMSYTGHGGVKGLMAELVLTNSDIQSMTNFDRLPFVHTATCEFSKFDNPSLVSAGEQLFLNPRGGAIGMLTTVRPTYAPTNQKMSKSFHEHVYDRENGMPLRMGDIIRCSKADVDYFADGNIGYVLFGDPALRLSVPIQTVGTSKINDQLSQSACTITAASKIQVDGMILPLGGRIDTLFNGVVDVRLYDKRSSFTTLGAMISPMTYGYYHDVLFEGKATVEHGRFSIELPVPIDVNYFHGKALLSYYAYDSIRGIDAAGVFDNLILTEADPATVQDHQGPDIHLYWNTPDYENGDHVSRNGILYADLFDEQGIYHYNVSIGRDIVLNSSLDDYDNVILNECYEPVVDDYRKGRIALPIRELDDGTYSFRIKVWDTQNNSSEAEIAIVVQEGIMLAEVHNYPNPFRDETRFSFVHGDKSEQLSVRIEVFDMLGRCVKEIQQRTAATAGVVPPILWDGRGSDGRPLRTGVYIYRLTVTDSEGKARSVSKRLVIG